MTRFGKIAAGALLMAGTAVATTAALTAPADARVVVGVGVGFPGYYGYPCCGYPYYYGYPGYYGGYYGGPYVGVGWGGGWGWHGGWRGRPGWGWRGGWHGGRWGGRR